MNIKEKYLFYKRNSLLYLNKVENHVIKIKSLVDLVISNISNSQCKFVLYTLGEEGLYAFLVYFESFINFVNLNKYFYWDNKLFILGITSLIIEELS